MSKLTHEEQVKLAKLLDENGYHNTEIAHILRLPETITHKMVETPVTNWGYNCLTAGIHHGRPEAIWNLSLYYAATQLFSKNQLALLVLTRIHRDALEFGYIDVKYDTKWAIRVRAYAEEHYMTTLQHKVGELSNYYKSDGFKADMDRTVELVEKDKLNRGYQPLHSHDSINMFCRILGTSASRAVS